MRKLFGKGTIPKIGGNVLADFIGQRLQSLSCFFVRHCGFFRAMVIGFVKEPCRLTRVPTVVGNSVRRILADLIPHPRVTLPKVVILPHHFFNTARRNSNMLPGFGVRR